MVDDEAPGTDAAAPRPRKRVVRLRLYLVRLVERLFATLIRQA